jgi:hypothetical protein
VKKEVGNVGRKRTKNEGQKWPKKVRKNRARSRGRVVG